MDQKPLASITLEDLPLKTVDVFQLRASVERGVKKTLNISDIVSDITDSEAVAHNIYNKQVQTQTDAIMTEIINDLFL